MALNENSREMLKKQKTEQSEQKPKKEKKQKVRVRLIPIWLRFVIVAVLICLSIVAGAAVGYGVIGDGQAFDIFKPSTWTHIFDLIEKK